MYDDLPKLMYGGAMVRPVRDSYSLRQPYGVTKSDVSGTLSRLVRTSFNGPSVVPCTIHLRDEVMMQWWDVFYEYDLAQGSKPFIAELLVNGLIKEHVCQIVEPPSISSPGWKADVSLTLEVVPVRDRCMDISLSLLLPCYGANTSCIIEQTIDVAKHLNGIWERE